MSRSECHLDFGLLPTVFDIENDAMWPLGRVSRLGFKLRPTQDVRAKVSTALSQASSIQQGLGFPSKAFFSIFNLGNQLLQAVKQLEKQLRTYTTLLNQPQMGICSGSPYSSTSGPRVLLMYGGSTRPPPSHHSKSSATG